MKYFKIHPKVSCCAYKHGVLHDKEAIYPETQWPEGEAMERVEKGFLVEVEAPTTEEEAKAKELAEAEAKAAAEREARLKSQQKKK